MRWSGVVLLLALSGCVHESGTLWSTTSLRAQLEQRVWQETPETLEARLTPLAPWNAGCDEEGCARCFTPPPQLHAPACLALRRVEGGTRLGVPDVWWVDEDVLAPVVAALRGTASTELPRDQLPRPLPRLGPVGGVHASVTSTDAFGFGARAGGRWWLDDSISYAAAVGYTSTFHSALVVETDPAPLDPAGQPRVVGGLARGHLVEVTARADIGARVGLLGGQVSVPRVALGVLGSFLLVIPGAEWDQRKQSLYAAPPVPALKLGFSLSAGKLGGYWMPVFLELSAVVGFGSAGVEGPMLLTTAGVGF